ncbi:glycosyltransferase family 2 protein [Flavobacterium algicola]|uniref:glycosyltransferase family 2 protein n=1 Tax=Flavobacterium algicola TaxID=556529 RepID=UPI001EFD4D45|nr:glycosyltransferase family 2 protein [Flavobacterium algicola]MCG9793513.1 glycosyltransferase [Flavobacterium algicola]
MKYSIGIPTFKGRYFEECIESIINQSYSDFELIIVNDCSPDDIEGSLAKFNDPRIRYYKNSVNTGAENVIDNWNKCLSLANGEYFVLMGDDDKFEPNYLEEFNKLIDNYPDLDVYHCGIKIINEESELIEYSNNCPEFETTNDYILNCIQGRSEQFISDFVYRSSALKNNNGFYKLPLAWCSDYTSAFIACGDKGIAYNSKPLFMYRKNQYNITSTSSLELKRLAHIGMEKWVEKYLDSSKFNSNIVKLEFAKYVILSREGFIKQVIGRDKFKGILNCIIKRNYFDISLNNILSVCFKKFT